MSQGTSTLTSEASAKLAASTSDIKTQVIKRNGNEVDFDVVKIVNAIKAANKEVEPIHQMNDSQIEAIAKNISDAVRLSSHAVNVEDIQDMVETGIMEIEVQAGVLHLPSPPGFHSCT